MNLSGWNWLYGWMDSNVNGSWWSLLSQRELSWFGFIALAICCSSSFTTSHSHTISPLPVLSPRVPEKFAANSRLQYLASARLILPHTFHSVSAIARHTIVLGSALACSGLRCYWAKPHNTQACFHCLGGSESLRHHAIWANMCSVGDGERVSSLA
jgi:hypothetical protein